MSAFDVAIVGAGPAGSASAITLAQQGFDVALIDRAWFPREKLCGDFLNPINWPVLETLTVSDAILARPHVKIATLRMTAASGAEATCSLPGPGARPFGLGLRRFDLDHVLLERAKQAGVSVCEGSKAVRLAREPHGWRLEMERAGDRSSVLAKCLVGADGRNSWVARRLGFSAAPIMAASSVGFQIQLKFVGAVRQSVEIHQFAGGYAGLVRVDDDTVNLGFAVRQSRLGRAVTFDKLRESLFCGNGHLDALLRDAQPVSVLRSVSPVYFPRRRGFGAGYLLAGDAARVTEPVTGEGIFLALRSGQLAAATIAAALRAGDLSQAGLSGYERACRNELGARMRLNSLVKLLMYRPRLFSRAIRLLGSRRGLMDSLVNAVCLPRAAFDN